MQNLSEWIGKPLLTRAGEHAGTVKNALLTKNLRTARALEYFDEQEEEHVLPLSAVTADGDALIVRSLAERPLKDAVPAPFGIAVYAETGERLGSVCDFLLEANAVFALLVTGGTTIDTARIVSIKDALIADLTSPLPVKPAKAQRKARPAAKAAASGPAPAPTPAPAPQPKAGSCLLTGKRAPLDVLDARGNVIVRKGALITAETLRRAMAHDKLFELTLSVLGGAR